LEDKGFDEILEILRILLRGACAPFSIAFPVSCTSFTITLPMPSKKPCAAAETVTKEANPMVVTAHAKTDAWLLQKGFLPDMMTLLARCYCYGAECNLFAK
jgi:hypothetical protein